MAEVAVAAVLGSLQIIIPLLTAVGLRKNEGDEIESIKILLSSSKAAIEDSYGSEGSSTQQDQANKVRKLAYDIEDVVDESLFHSPSYAYHRHGIYRSIHAQAHQISHGFPRAQVSEKITKLKQNIEQHISLNSIFGGDRLPSSSSSSAQAQLVGRVCPLLRDDDMVGYGDHKTEFQRLLLDAGEKRLVTLGVYGPPGSGKTTLVKNVFWEQQIRAKFECHAWVCVSQNPNIEEILENMLKQVCNSREVPFPSPCSDDGSSVVERLHSRLAGKKFLVVLDDIWRHQDWKLLKEALPAEDCFSRIVVTTRDSFCAKLSHDHGYNLPGLKYPDAFELFRRKAFNGECPLQLKDICSKIVERCGGMPLAILAVADALQQLKPQCPSEWEGFYVSEIFNGYYNALQRSYVDLSSSLKCCLLYMSLFPEDYTVERGRLIRLWVAEGLATALPTRDMTAEEVAEGYLSQLIHRNLLHVSNSDSHGRPTNCHLQDPVLSFIIQKCKDNNFASIFPSDQIQTIQNPGGQMVRRLSVQNHFKHLPQNGNFAHVRSMFLLRMPTTTISCKDFEKILDKLELVKVVDVQGAPLTEFPKEITRFTLMRYLSFRDTKIKSIPSSIKKLSYLETLDLKQTDVTELPQEISHLHNLRHLLVYKKTDSSVQGVKLHPKGIGKLEQLQNLSLVQVDPNGEILKDLRRMIRLRKLGLTGLRWEHGKDLCTAVELMEKLTSLNLWSATMPEYIALQELKNPPKTLERLYLNGRLETFPPWISKLNSLLKIRLKWSKLENFPLRELASLPNLTEMHLLDCFSGGELIFGASGFKKLKILVLEELTNLHTMVIHEGAVAELKQMSLRRCRRMRMFLGGENLVKIEELTLHDMPQGLIACFTNNGEHRRWVCNTHQSLSDFVSFSPSENKL